MRSLKYFVFKIFCKISKAHYNWILSNYFIFCRKIHVPAELYYTLCRSLTIESVDVRNVISGSKMSLQNRELNDY